MDQREKVQDVKKVQTLLFSATIPEWLKKISSRFLKPEKRTADLVGNEKLKASATVRHLLLPCSRATRAQLIPDVICCYSCGGRTIIFTEMKESASELAGLLPGARALHGDIMQWQREVILAGLRSGRFSVLVATNVAARRLDINDVQLIIQVEPPVMLKLIFIVQGELGGPCPVTSKVAQRSSARNKKSLVVESLQEEQKTDQEDALSLKMGKGKHCKDLESIASCENFGLDSAQHLENCEED